MVAGATGTVAVVKIFNRKEKSFDHYVNIETHASVRCVSFNPLKDELLAIGLFNGNIMLYDI